MARRGLDGGQDAQGSTPSGDEFFAAVVQLSPGQPSPANVGPASELASPTEVYVVVGDRTSQLFAEAADRGLSGALASGETLDAAITHALDQVLELDRLRAQALRMAVIERAKGVLMERQRLSERTAYERMRKHARALNLRLIDVADAIVKTHLLLERESQIFSEQKQRPETD